MENFWDIIFPIKCGGCFQRKGPICAKCIDNLTFCFDSYYYHYKRRNTEEYYITSTQIIFILNATPFTEKLIDFIRLDLYVYLKHCIKTSVLALANNGHVLNAKTVLFSAADTNHKFNQYFAKCVSSQYGCSTYDRYMSGKSSREYACLLALEYSDEVGRELNILERYFTNVTLIVLFKDVTL